MSRARLPAKEEDSGFGGSRGMMVLLLKQVHLQKEAGAIIDEEDSLAS